CARDQTNHDYW
nr:immunoglobulin heavy chain junction region [Macaca mulatta]